MGARLSFVALATLVGCSDAHLNEPPVLADFTIEAQEDTAVTAMVAATDPEGDDLLVELATPPAHGLAVVNGLALTYTPTTDYNGADSLTVTVYDHKNPRITATASITVGPGNDAPVGMSDIVAAAEDTPRTIAASTLLANDTDLDGDTLSITAVGAPTDGTVALTGTDIVFTPTANFSGTAGFQYTLSDGTATATVNVEVDVGGQNDPPVAGDDVATTAEDTPLDILTLLANDTDPDQQALSIQSVLSGTGGLVSHAGDTVTFTPGLDFHGTATFTYVVTDGVLTDTGTVTVTVTPVNDAPVAVNDAGTTSEDTPFTFTALVSNDSDVDGDTLTVSAVANPVNGTVNYNGGQPIFTPDANYGGSASFEYTVSDGAGGTDTGTVTITVNAVNDPPVAVDDVGTTSEDTPLTITDLAANDTDVEGATLTVTAVSNFSNCTVALNGGSPIVTPTANFSGTATFDYTVSDGAGGTDTGTVTITVTAVPDVTAVAPSTVQILASGGTAILRVDIDNASSSDVVIDLASAAPSSIAVPSTVTIPAGATSATFRVRADATTATSAITITASLAGTGSSATSAATVVTTAVAPTTADLVINELNYYVDTTGLTGDANCDGTADSSQDEFFELSNRSSAPVQLSGVSFWDATAIGGATPGYTFPSFVLGPGEVVVVFSGLVGTTNVTSPWCTNLDGTHIGDARAFGASHTFGLNNTGGETVHLTATASNSSTELVTAISIPSGTAGQAYARNPDFTGAFVKDGIGIGATDRTISPGTLITGAPFASAGP